ncbi:GNAT family N-acetyltransferase [Hymenobacter sp. HMF4947]|uniref:GNAT family N-acetyltransferase n=1 Tax=Hymenobacter ginkgonis TaxID=2682976 RepID=A0A7K1TGF3_9BACT|nr:GNAT family N-acetyltransferase [Hymenobacter ginkgonis]MVN77494.1 GNAT family N-acetyltransferase [Hymenobacter ginkgonis]
MPITYTLDAQPTPAQVIDLYRSAGLVRPIENPARIAQMYQHANLVISAWAGDQLVGVARSLSDFCYCCYLSDLAVHQDYQRQGIGKRLVALTKEAVGDESMLLLLAAPAAMPYYPALGMTPVDNGFIIKRLA